MANVAGAEYKACDITVLGALADGEDQVVDRGAGDLAAVAVGGDVDQGVVGATAGQAIKGFVEAAIVVEVSVKNLCVASVFGHTLDERQHASTVAVMLVQLPRTLQYQNGAGGAVQFFGDFFHYSFP